LRNHLDDFHQVLMQFIQRLPLRVCTWETGNVTNVQPRMWAALDDSDVIPHRKLRVLLAYATVGDSRFSPLFSPLTPIPKTTGSAWCSRALGTSSPFSLRVGTRRSPRAPATGWSC